MKLIERRRLMVFALEQVRNSYGLFGENTISDYAIGLVRRALEPPKPKRKKRMPQQQRVDQSAV